MRANKMKKFRIKTNNSSVWKGIAKILKAYLITFNLLITDRYMIIQDAKESENQEFVLVEMCFPAENFLEFSTEGISVTNPSKIGMTSKSFFQAIKPSTTKNNIEFVFNSKDPNDLEIVISSKTKNTSRSIRKMTIFDHPLCDLKSPIFDKESPNVLVDASTFKKSLQELRFRGEIRITASKTHIRLEEISELNMRKIEEWGDYNENILYDNVFPADRISNSLGIASETGFVKVYITGPNYPIIFAVENSIGFIRIYINH